MEYTEGKWEAIVQKASRYWKAEVRTPDTMDEEGKHAIAFGQLVAVCYGKNTVANAHLIASAPIMAGQLKTGIEALSEAINHLNGQEIDEAKDYIKGVIAGNELAIAKAERG